ncbi:MAG TPA: serine protease [Burkholderiaceae bacterium]|nr:serine protease [Burkholderiaceae bacterium]
MRAAAREARARARLLLAIAGLIAGGIVHGPAASQAPPGIAIVRPSVLAIGTFQATRVPQFRFLGTGFAVADGTLAATSAHVLPASLDPGADPELIVALLPGNEPTRAAARRLTQLVVDREHDIAVLRMDGSPLPPLKLRDSATVVEGESLMLTGFPIGGALGLFPVTHRAMVAAIAPVAIPSMTGQQLDPKVIRRLRDAAFSVFQLDATAYPGNSGSPVYDPVTGEVVGILNMAFVKGTKEAALTQPSGISYAIPSSFLIEVLQRVPR